MSTPLSSTVFDNAPAVRSRIRLPPSRWLREPLLHFVILGAALFALDHLLVARSDDPRTIVVGAAVDAEAKELFKNARGREPTAEEREALRRVWLDNEILYREGLAMQVDKGDSAIRERVIFKALMTVEAGVKLPSIDDGQLRAWFESHRTKYDEPRRFDFLEAALAGQNSEETVREFVAELNAGAPGDSRAGLRVFKRRPVENLVQSYGAEFARELEGSPAGVWRALHARDGWRAIRLEAISAPIPANFDVLRNVVMQDWKDSLASDQRTSAVRQLEKKYHVKFERSST